MNKPVLERLRAEEKLTLEEAQQPLDEADAEADH
jgi:hypothetical protein